MAGRLVRTRPAAPARIVHLGLGAFHRAHQAWYTAHAPDAGRWGITAFSSYRRELVATLEEQDCLYTLVERGDDGDRFDVIDSLVEARPGSDEDRLHELLSDPAVACVTLTITEVGYQLAGPTAGRSPLGRLVRALDHRRRCSGAPIALVPCDNLPGNAAVLRDALLELAAVEAPGLMPWFDDAVSLVSTSVDRITPETTPELERTVAEHTGRIDRAPVVTEPFAEWVLSGDFPAGHPAWEEVGARLVSDIRPWQTRKLWMLNGAHSLLAAAGTVRGHRTVAAAIGDPVIARAVEQLWDEDLRHLPDLDGAAYRRALVARFGNARIEHRLDQIARDMTTKLQLRVAPVALAERRAGRSATGAAAALGAWSVADRTAPGEVVRQIVPELAGDAEFIGEVEAAASSWQTGSPNR